MRLLIAVIILNLTIGLASSAYADDPPRASADDAAEVIGYFLNSHSRESAFDRARQEAREHARASMKNTGASHVAVRMDFYEVTHPDSVFAGYEARVGKAGSGKSPDEAAEDMILRPQITQGPPGSSEHLQSIYVVFGPDDSESVLTPATVREAHIAAVDKVMRTREGMPQSDGAKTSTSSSRANAPKKTNDSSSSAQRSSTAEKWKRAMDTMDDPKSSQADRDRAGREAAEAMDEVMRTANIARCAPGTDCVACPECSGDRSSAMLLQTMSYTARVQRMLRATHSLDRQRFSLKGTKVLGLP